MPVAATARAPIKGRWGKATQGSDKLTAIHFAENELTKVILNSVPPGRERTKAVGLIKEAVAVATSGIMYNGA